MNKESTPSSPEGAGVGTSGAGKAQAKGKNEAFRLGCQILRLHEKLNFARYEWSDLDPTKPEKGLAMPKRGESIVDWMVRVGLAETPQDALEGLLLAAGATQGRDEALRLLEDPSF